MKERPDSDSLVRMQPRLDPEEVKAFVNRWKIVREEEVAELRATPLARKLETAAALMASGRALGWATTDPTEVEAVRARWQALADRCRA